MSLSSTSAWIVIKSPEKCLASNACFVCTTDSACQISRGIWQTSAEFDGTRSLHTPSSQSATNVLGEETSVISKSGCRLRLRAPRMRTHDYDVNACAQPQAMHACMPA